MEDTDTHAKHAMYADLVARLRKQLGDEDDYIANAANVASGVHCMLRTHRGDAAVNWVGFYFVRQVLHAGQDPATEARSELVLGPFQGKPAVVRIPFEKGVCGAAARSQSPVLVKDVHEFPGHIACDSASQSEVVVPVFAADGRLAAVLDLDSPMLNGFDEEDVRGLSQVRAL